MPPAWRPRPTPRRSGAARWSSALDSGSEDYLDGSASPSLSSHLSGRTLLADRGMRCWSLRKSSLEGTLMPRRARFCGPGENTVLRELVDSAGVAGLERMCLRRMCLRRWPQGTRTAPPPPRPQPLPPSRPAGDVFAPALFAGDRRMGAPKIDTVGTSPRNRERNVWELGTSAGDALGTRGR